MQQLIMRTKVIIKQRIAYFFVLLCLKLKIFTRMEKLFLLDAYALIYRAYYAFIKNPRINSKGFNTSAVLGFVNTLEDVLKKEEPYSHRNRLRPCRTYLPP